MNISNKTKDYIFKQVSRLKVANDKRMFKYRRNYRRYINSRSANIEDIKNPSLVGIYTYENSIEDDLNYTPDINVIKSCIDTIVSKIAQSKVRPYFNCINGSFKDIQIVKQSQQFFDIMFDKMNVNNIVSNAWRDACIFDTGCIFIDEDLELITKAFPWQIYMLPEEVAYNRKTKLYVEQKDYPVSAIPEYIIKSMNKRELARLDDLDTVTYCRYYDTKKQLKSIYISEMQFWYVNEKWEKEVLPIINLYYNEPITGGTSSSIVDILYTIQNQIDLLNSRIKDASMLNPAQTFFVPSGSDVKVGQLNNRVGNIITYKATPNMTGVPVLSSTPDFISNQYISMLNELKETAYELVGISQLSAQSQKPTGLNSGIALQTMENIESDRFETQLNQIVKAYVDIAKICIFSFDKDKNILPQDNKRVNIKWKDIINEYHKMSIQFSGADMLSKDPSTKLEQLQALAQSGIIPQARVAQFMEIPDLQGGYSLSNNAVNAVMTTIDECLTKDNFEVDDFIPFTLLKEEIINTQLSLKAADSEKNKDDIEKLNKLYEIVENKENEWTTTVQEGEIAATGEQPYYGNVLEQEANMQQVAGGAANAPINEPVQNMNIDSQAGGNVAGNWNG